MHMEARCFFMDCSLGMVVYEEIGRFTLSDDFIRRAKADIKNGRHWKFVLDNDIEISF